MANASEMVEEPARPEFTLGDRMRKARDHAGLSQSAMGEKLAPVNRGKPVKHTTIATWERDVHQPRSLMDILARWAEVTGVDYYWLVGADNPRYVNVTGVTTPLGQMELPLLSLAPTLELV